MGVNRHLTTVRNEDEARVIIGRLAEAGIHAWPSGIRRAVPLARDIYVDDADLERARQVLGEAERITEDELVHAEEADAAARSAERQARSEVPTGKPRGATAASREQPAGALAAPRRGLWDRLLGRGGQ